MEAAVEKALQVQRDALRTIQRHFLHPLEQHVDLGGRRRPPDDELGAALSQTDDDGKRRPTLATMTRFYRLRKLNARLQDTIECGEALLRWVQEKAASAPPGVLAVVEAHLPRVVEASKTLADNWVSSKVVLDAAYCSRHVKAMEFKITQFHKHLEELVKVYIAMMTKVLEHPDKKRLVKMPIDIRQLDSIEISMPPNYATHSAKADHST